MATKIMTPEVEEKIAAGQKMLANSVLLQLSFSRWGINRKLSKTEYEVDADKKRTSAQKRLIECKEYDAIRSHDVETAAWVRDRSVPSPFRAGMYQIALSTIEAVLEYLDKRVEAREALVTAFLDAYDDAVESAAKPKSDGGLGALFRGTDYPSRERVGKHFWVDTRVLTFDTPDALKKVRAGLYEREKKKLDLTIAQAVDDVNALLMAELQGMVDHMVEKMKPGEDGKRKKLHASLIPNVTAFLDQLPSRNLTGNDELTQVAKQMRDLLSGVDVDMLKKEEGLRASVGQGFSKIKERIDASMETVGRRRMRL